MLVFPPDFIFGTSTSAYQIETAFEHDWEGIQSEDGHVFKETTNHEENIDSDVEIIASLAPHYRMSLMWSKLQRSPYQAMHEETKVHYHHLMRRLQARKVNIMLVLHHFCNPAWFAANGGWTKSSNVAVFVDFGKKIVDEYGQYVSSWNTFNEPNLYATLAFAVGKFPPYKRNLITARTVISNMARAHNLLYDYIKQRYPDHQIGISHNCAVFEGVNLAGTLIAALADKWYMEFMHSHFTKVDFTGLSYYARIAFDPSPITYRYSPKKIKKLSRTHDDVWEYYPEGLKTCVLRYWKAFGKPIIITENGICTSNDTKRVGALKDYMRIIADLLKEGVDIRGYYHWSTWDNFEWTLGPTFRFGLYACDVTTNQRTKKPSADIYAKLAYEKMIDV